MGDSGGAGCSCDVARNAQLKLATRDSVASGPRIFSDFMLARVIDYVQQTLSIEYALLQGLKIPMRRSPLALAGD